MPKNKIYILLFLMICLLLKAELSVPKTQVSDEKSELFIKRSGSFEEQNPSQVILDGERLLKEITLETTEEKKHNVDLLNKLAHAYILIGDYELAIKKANQSKLLAELINYDAGLAYANNNIAYFYTFIDDYESALNYYLDALTFGRKLGDTKLITKALSNVAQIYNKINNFEESVRVYKESLELLEVINDQRSIGFTLGGIADAYRRMNSYEQALDFAQQSIDVLQKSNDKMGLVFSYHLLGEIHVELGDYAEAKKSFDLSLKLGKENNVFLIIASVYVNLAKVALAERHYDLAEEYASNALETAKVKNELALQSDSLKTLSTIYETQGKTKAAFDYFKQHKIIENQIFNEKSDRNISALRTSFEVDQLDRQNQLLKQQNQIIQINVEKQKVQNNLLIVFFLLALSVIGFIYYRFTHTKKLQHEKLENEQLRSVNDMKDQILMNTSHEFRTPLAGIIGLADCLREGLMGAQSDEAKNSLVLITNSGKRLTGLVDDIINFAQLKNGNCVLNHDAVDVYQALTEVTTTCSSLLTEKNLIINNTLSSGEFIAFADEQRLIQILFNLIGNAIKYSHQGEIKITAEQTDFEITVHISDQGIGIPKNKLTTIFEYFEQVDATASRAEQGSGLGLAIVKSLVELQGGSITVESILGEGSIFTFTLPRVIEQEKTVEQEQESGV